MLTTTRIGNKITDARKRLNLSQAQLANQLSISAQAVGKWERGESMPDIITLSRLAEILGVDLNYFSNEIDLESAEKTAAAYSVQQLTGLKTVKERKKLSWDMSLGNWLDADFSGLNNLHEKFSSSNMLRCKFIGSDMSGLILKNNNVDNCDFSSSEISGSHIQRSNLANTNFKECSLKVTEFSESYIMGCDFTGADFSGVSFKTGGFQNNKITDAVWNGTVFKNMQLTDIIFNGKVDDCYFENCSFKKVTFQLSTLRTSFFKNKSLKGIRFIDCRADRMTYEFLKNGKADLNGIELYTTKGNNE